MKFDTIRVKEGEIDKYIEQKEQEGFLVEDKNFDDKTQGIILMKRDEGKLKYHFILLILSAFYIFGLFNIIYFIYTYYVNSQKILILPQ